MSLCILYAEYSAESPTEKRVFMEGFILSRGVQVPATILLPDIQDNQKVPLVVFAHGHGGTRAEAGFAAIMQTLVKQGIACIAIDFPGCGDSQESFAQNALRHMKADVVAALQHMIANYPVDAQKTGIFGYSMGGRVALEVIADGLWSFAAMALLAPGASTGDAGRFVGGSEAGFAAMQKTAEETGFAVFKTPFGQRQELSRMWFHDLLRHPEDIPELAAARFTGRALVFFGKDDPVVSHAVVCRVAKVLSAPAVDVSGDLHSYGFYSDRKDILNTIVEKTAAFFAQAFAE